MISIIERKKNGIIGALIGGLLLTYLPAIVTSGVNGWIDVKLDYFTEREDIFDYILIAPDKNPNDRDGSLSMVSSVIWYQEGWDITYNYILRCEGDTGFTSSDFNTRLNWTFDKDAGQRLGDIFVYPWQYNGASPSYPTTCVIDATVKVCKRDTCFTEKMISEPILYR